MRDLKDLLQAGYCARVDANDDICRECRKYFGNCIKKELLTANDFMEYAKANFEPAMTKEEAQKIMLKSGICLNDFECNTNCKFCKYSTSKEERERALEVLKNDN